MGLLDNAINESMNNHNSYAKHLNEFGFDMCLSCPVRFECKIVTRITKTRFTGHIHVAIRTNVALNDDHFASVVDSVPCLTYKEGEYRKIWACNKEMVWNMIGCDKSGYYQREEWSYG